MSEVEIKQDEHPQAEVLTGAKKLAVLVGVAGVMGFAVGWLMSTMSDQWGGPELGGLGLCLGALVGGIIGRLSTREAK